VEHGDWLVVLTCFNHLEKYYIVNGKDYNIYEMEKKIFQTTNQLNNLTAMKHWAFTIRKGD